MAFCEQSHQAEGAEGAGKGRSVSSRISASNHTSRVKAGQIHTPRGQNGWRM